MNPMADEPEEPNTIDELMDRDPLELTEQDLDAIIAYQRKQRARYEAGEKPSKPKGPAVGKSGVDLLKALGMGAKPDPTFKRRV